MSNLEVFKFDGVDVVDSRQVAEMIGKRHDNLLRDIQNYCDVIEKNGLLKNEESAGQCKIMPFDFFIPSVYINSQNKEQPCYLLTKKGCDMVANKMTGEKGVLFTAAYVTAFEAMREHIQTKEPVAFDVADLKEVLNQIAEIHKSEAAAISNVASILSEMKDDIKSLKNPSPVPAPAATAAESPRCSKAMSPWRSNMYSIAKPLARRMNITVKQLMFNIYKQMRTDYSWDFLTEKKKYILNHGESKDISTVDVIEDSEMYSSIFMAILKDVYTANTLETPEWHEINAADVALAPIEASAVEAPTHDRRCKADNIPWCDKVSKAINDFAILRGDKTANHMATYRMVFNALDKSKVDAIRARYVKRYGLPKRSAQIFNSKQRAQMIFDAIEELKEAM